MLTSGPDRALAVRRAAGVLIALASSSFHGCSSRPIDDPPLGSASTSDDQGSTDESTSGPVGDLAVVGDSRENCTPSACFPELLGLCSDGSECVDDALECAVSFAGRGLPFDCAPVATQRRSDHEACNTLDASGLQECDSGRTCWGPRGSESGACHELCATTSQPSGTCETSGDVCLYFQLPGTTGGLCVRRCNPLEVTPCPHTPTSKCVDVGHADDFNVSGDGAIDDVLFACIPAIDGGRLEREPCEPARQHVTYGSVEDATNLACAAGLTCAFHEFADQSAPLLQCLRICDAPEDCLPTETCVSSLEFTESVSEPVGVCEVM